MDKARRWYLSSRRPAFRPAAGGSAGVVASLAAEACWGVGDGTPVPPASDSSVSRSLEDMMFFHQRVPPSFSDAEAAAKDAVASDGDGCRWMAADCAECLLSARATHDSFGPYCLFGSFSLSLNNEMIIRIIL